MNLTQQKKIKTSLYLALFISCLNSSESYAQIETEPRIPDLTSEDNGNILKNPDKVAKPLEVKTPARKNRKQAKPKPSPKSTPNDKNSTPEKSPTENKIADKSTPENTQADNDASFKNNAQTSTPSATSIQASPSPIPEESKPKNVRRKREKQPSVKNISKESKEIVNQNTSQNQLETTKDNSPELQAEINSLKQKLTLKEEELQKSQKSFTDLEDSLKRSSLEIAQLKEEKDAIEKLAQEQKVQEDSTEKCLEEKQKNLELEKQVSLLKVDAELKAEEKQYFEKNFPQIANNIANNKPSASADTKSNNTKIRPNQVQAQPKTFAETQPQQDSKFDTSGLNMPSTNPTKTQFGDGNANSGEVTADVPIVITNTKVNLRSGPGLEHSPVMEVDKGSRLVVESRAGQWFRVISPNGSRAYIKSDVVSIPASQNSLPNPGTNPNVYKAEGPPADYLEGLRKKNPDRPVIKIPSKKDSSKDTDKNDNPFVPFGDVKGSAR